MKIIINNSTLIWIFKSEKVKTSIFSVDIKYQNCKIFLIFHDHYGNKAHLNQNSNLHFPRM